MADMKPVSIDGTAVINVGGVEVTKKFSISAAASVVFDGALGIGKISMDGDEFKRKSDLIKEWIKAFPSELENG